jgi:adenylate cyclase
MKRKIHLSSIMLFSFGFLSIVPLTIVLFFNYTRNEAGIFKTLEEQFNKTSKHSIQSVTQLLSQSKTTMSLVANSIILNPESIKTEQFNSILWRGLQESSQIDALYVSLEDGYHRVVTRVDEARRKSDPNIPENAKWHASHIDSFDAGERRARHLHFYRDWGKAPEKQYSVPTKLDIRTLDHYAQAKQTRKFAISKPSINPHTGGPVISLGWPIFLKNKFIGFIGANMTFDLILAYFKANPVSRNGMVVIIDESGRVITHPGKQNLKVFEKFGGLATAGAAARKRIEFVSAETIEDAPLREAFSRRTRGTNGVFHFDASTGVEISASSRLFPLEFGLNWEIMVLAPTDDFVGELKATNKIIAQGIFVIIIISLIFVYFFARGLSKSIERVSWQFEGIRDFSFKIGSDRNSRIMEISDLQNGLVLLQSALSSFVKFVPVGVVRHLVSSGTTIVPGVDKMAITILFCDLENFSTQAEKLSSEDLLQQLNEYFSLITGAVAEEEGTVDKFIGDAVMALWGAPNPQADHVVKGCVAALKAKKRMHSLLTAWRAQGKPEMRVRIGLHCGEVLVGNVGSPERLAYTAIGDGVNVAARLEGTNKLFGSTICISEDVRSALGKDAIVRPLRFLTLKGRVEQVMVYELLGLNGDMEDDEVAAGAREIFIAEKSFEAFNLGLTGQYSEALILYNDILEVYPDDQVSRQILEDVTMEFKTINDGV